MGWLPARCFAAESFRSIGMISAGSSGSLEPLNRSLLPAEPPQDTKMAFGESGPIPAQT